MSRAELWDILGVSFAGAASLATLIGVFFAIYAWRVASRREISRFDSEANQALLSYVREHYENQIQELNQKLVSTEGRWAELNHLLIDRLDSETADPSSTGVSLERFLNDLGTKGDDLSVDDRMIFVLTPFNERERSTFTTISKVCERFGLRAVRGDEEFTDGDILPHIVRLIGRSRFVIANVTGRNPNVYYELGIAHAMGKHTIIVSRTLDDATFDISSKRIVIFSTQQQLDLKLSSQMAHTVVSI